MTVLKSSGSDVYEKDEISWTHLVVYMYNDDGT